MPNRFLLRRRDPQPFAVPTRLVLPNRLRCRHLVRRWHLPRPTRTVGVQGMPRRPRVRYGRDSTSPVRRRLICERTVKGRSLRALWSWHVPRRVAPDDLQHMPCRLCVYGWCCQRKRVRARNHRGEPTLERMRRLCSRHVPVAGWEHGLHLLPRRVELPSAQHRCASALDPSTATPPPPLPCLLTLTDRCIEPRLRSANSVQPGLVHANVCAGQLHSMHSWYVPVIERTDRLHHVPQRPLLRRRVDGAHRLPRGHVPPHHRRRLGERLWHVPSWFGVRVGRLCARAVLGWQLQPGGCRHLHLGSRRVLSGRGGQHGSQDLPRGLLLSRGFEHPGAMSRGHLRQLRGLRVRGPVQGSRREHVGAPRQ